MPKPYKWKQGEHVVIVGDTGSGKTYLESKLLDLRDYVIVARTKPDDIKFTGYRRIDDIKKVNLRLHTKYLLVPKYELQGMNIAHAMTQVFKEGGWTFAIDETYYATAMLKLERPINKLFTQGRSKHLSIVAGMQRPAWISRFTLSQSTHAFIFRCEGRDLMTLSQAMSPRLSAAVEGLTGYDFAYYNRATREVSIGNANRLEELITK